MSLTFVVPGPLDQATGGYRFGRQVVDGLRAQGRRVQVAELPGRFQLVDPLQAPLADAPAREAAAQLLRAQPDDAIVVIDGLALPAFDEALPAHAQRLRTVGFVHHPLADETGLPAAAVAHLRQLEPRLWRQLRGLVCPSAHTASALQRAGVAAPRIAVVPPGTARAGPRTARRRPGPLRLLSVASVTPRKGQRLLVQALAGLRDLPWRLHCVGSLTRDPAEAQALRESLDALGLAAHVHLLGECSDTMLRATYADADVFVLPSYHEGYGMACAEALAHGLPLITTAAGALAHTVPAAAALHVPVGDSAALRSALHRVITDTALRQRLARGAGDAALQLPDPATSTQRWTAALDRLTA